MHAPPPARAVGKAPRGKGPRTRAEAHKRRQRRQSEAALDSRHQAETGRRGRRGRGEVAAVLTLPPPPLGTTRRRGR